MKTYVLDSNAMIRYMNQSADWRQVKALFDGVRTGDVRLYMSVVNWGEVTYISAKYSSVSRAVADLKSLGVALETVDVDEDAAEEAATLKFNYRLGYGDSYAAALAMRMNATLVTADANFAKLGKKLKLMVLARHVR